MTDNSRAELIELLDSNNAHARAVAAIQLGQQNVRQALPKLLEFINDKDDIVALAGMYACWLLGEDKVSIERIIKALDSENEEVIQQVIQTVTAMGDILIPKLEPLINQSPGVTINALNLLEEIGGPSALAVIKTVKTTDPEVAELVEEILEDWDYDTPRELN